MKIKKGPLLDYVLGDMDYSSEGKTSKCIYRLYSQVVLLLLEMVFRYHLQGSFLSVSKGISCRGIC